MRREDIDEGELSVYEIGYLILPSISEDKVVLVTDSIRGVVTKEGGIEIDAEEPFKEPLAYQMSKVLGAIRYTLSEAYVGWIKFEAERAKALAIKAGVEKIDEVLRFLMIKAPRETTFTFAKARAVIEAPTLEEVVVPTPPTESSEGVGKEKVVK